MRKVSENELQQCRNGDILLQIILKLHYMCQFFNAVLRVYVTLILPPHDANVPAMNTAMQY